MGRHADAVVAHRQAKAGTGGAGESDGEPLGVCVFRDVAQGFLRDPIETGCDEIRDIRWYRLGPK